MQRDNVYYKQLNIFEYLGPQIGSIIYFTTCRKVKKATVISHDASFAGLPYTRYIKVRDSKNQIWSVKAYYYSRLEAMEHT